METVVVAQENGHKLLFFFNLRLQNPVDLTLNGTWQKKYQGPSFWALDWLTYFS